jgi:hypothetical protein
MVYRIPETGFTAKQAAGREEIVRHSGIDLE